MKTRAQLAAVGLILLGCGGDWFHPLPLPRLTVTSLDPAPGSVLDSPPTEITVTFSTYVEDATVDDTTFLLTRSGGDGTFDDGNEVAIAPDAVALTAAEVVTMDLTSASLPDDVYRLTAVARGAGKALQFDGSDDCVTVPSTAALNPSVEITVEAWVRFEQGGASSPRIVSKGAEGFGDNAYELLTIGTGSSRQIRAHLESGSATTGAYFGAGVWHHVAMTYDQVALRVYVNGDVEAEYVGSGTIGSTTYPLTFGRKTATPNDTLKGRLDEIRLWSVARTQTEIQSQMHRPLKGDEAALVGYWRLDDGGGQSVADSSAFGHHGTLGGNSSPGGDDPARVDSTAPMSFGVRNTDGKLLDGEFAGAFPSGDGNEGGDFVATFTVDVP